MHSPFLFDLYNRVVKPSRNLIPHLEQQKKKKLKALNQVIDVIDFKTGVSRRSTVGDVARTSLSSSCFSNFLRLLCEELQVKVVLETGTSLGINALYLAEASSVEKVVSIEGSETIHYLARKTVKDHQKIYLVHGDLYQQFEMQIVQHQPDLVFLDADHRGSALDFCLDIIDNQLPFVQCIAVHDIYWSRDMTNWWKKTVAKGAYNLTVDVFDAGLIFPNYPIEKQHFTLKF